MPVQSINPAHNFSYDGVSILMYKANRGQGLPRHEHYYSHATYCCQGSMIARKEGIELLLTKESQPVNLKAQEWHEIEAAEDDTVFFHVFSEGKN